MKNFQIPEVNVIRYEIEDVIATSNGGVNKPIETPDGPDW